MSAVELFVFRHGQTDWNVEKRFQGHTDIPLNDTGRAQALQLAHVLKGCALDIILTSDLARAAETARIVASLSGVPIVTSPALREALLGEPEGQKLDDIVARYGAESWDRFRSTKNADLDFAYPKGETKREQIRRLHAYIESHVAAHPHVRIGISTHGASARRLVHHAINDELIEPVAMGNCALHRVGYDRATRAWRYLGEIASDAP